MKPRVVYFGTPDFVIPVLQALFNNFDLVGVVTAPDTIQGRKKLLTPSPIKQHSQTTYPKISIFTPEQFNNEIIQQIVDLKPDLFVVAAYGKIIPQSVLDIPQYGSLNIHPSLLPKYRGPSPIQSMLLQGDKVSGVTLIKMDSLVDHGPIISQWEISVNDHDTFESLHISMFQDAAEKLPSIISQYIEGNLTLLPQDESKATYCQKISRESGYFDSANPPDHVTLDRMIRAYYPWPTAWTRVRLKNGEEKIMKLLPEGKVQMEGKNVVTVKEFLNGYPELQGLINKLLGIN